MKGTDSCRRTEDTTIRHITDVIFQVAAVVQSCSRAIDTRSENKGLCISIKVFDNRFLHPNEVHSNLVQILKGLNLLISPKTHTG